MLLLPPSWIDLTWVGGKYESSCSTVSLVSHVPVIIILTAALENNHTSVNYDKEINRFYYFCLIQQTVTCSHSGKLIFTPNKLFRKLGFYHSSISVVPNGSAAHLVVREIHANLKFHHLDFHRLDCLYKFFVVWCQFSIFYIVLIYLCLH